MTTSTLLSLKKLTNTNKQYLLEDLQTLIEQQFVLQQKKEKDIKEWLNTVQQLTAIVVKQKVLQANKNKANFNVSPQIIEEFPFSENPLLKSLRQHILEHLDATDLDVAKISRIVGLSRTQLYRKVKALTNLSITQFVNIVKIEVAKSLLLATNYTISEIAYESGFQSLAYFSRVFNKVMLCTPTKYRKAGKKLLMQHLCKHLIQ